MVALVGALGAFHLTQQGIHLRNGQLAPGTHGAMAGKGRQKFVAARGKHLTDAVLTQFGQQAACQRRRIGRLELRRNAAHGQLRGTKRC